MKNIILISLLSFLLISCANEDMSTFADISSPASPLPLEQDATMTPQSTMSVTATSMPATATSIPATEIPPTASPTPRPQIVAIPGVELFDFTTRPNWYTVDDNVMGGVSNSEARIIDENLSFSGMMSLENNGGFSSVRSEWIPIDLSDYDGILLRVLGDGKTYRLRIRSAETGPNISYNASFETTPDSWEIFYFPFADMVPTYFGTVVDVDKLDTSRISSFGFMLSDKQPGEFELLVDWIRVVSDQELNIVSMN
jgi:NADH dehydrogenase [ubiquinone] 1 alpha subcomplex assembly factor 1